LGSIGAGFVIGIKLVANWFPPKMIGRAEGFYAGWGNFGSAGASFVLAFIAVNIMQGWFGFSAEGAWRWSLAFSSLACALYGVVFYFIVRDTPEGRSKVLATKTEPMKVSSYFDLAQYIVWSFPLMGAMGLLAWRLQRVNMTHSDGTIGPLFSSGFLYATWALLGLIYVAHVVKVLQVNLPYLRAGVPEDEKYAWSSVAALNTTYFANFGAELAVVSMLPMFFQGVFKDLTNDGGELIMTPQLAGMVAGSFAFVNLFARPLGGLLSDLMTRRKTVMLLYMAGISLGFLGMSWIAKLNPDGQLVPTFDGISWLVISVVITVVASIFVQGAEGATFAIIPMIHKKYTGQIAGMAGAYGNVGAVVYLVIFAMVDAKTFFMIASGGALFSMLYCWAFLKEPKASHEDHAS
jgi:NNP family nitrate/nitrite transporter-like MFS transporter